jgi:hypothetical protein
LYRWGAGLFADVKGLQQQQAESPRRYVNFGPKQIKGYHSSIAVHEGDAWKKRLLTWNITPEPPASATSTPSSTTTPDNK